ncbi:MAG: histidine kinase [Selenomonadaceae bacterium]
MSDKKYMDLNAEDGIERFMGNEPLYRKYLEDFLYDASFVEFCTGVEMDDMAMADKALHTLMGTSSNLSLERLFHATNKAAQGIFAGKQGSEMEKLVKAVYDAYADACDDVRAYLGKKE